MVSVKLSTPLKNPLVQASIPAICPEKGYAGHKLGTRYFAIIMITIAAKSNDTRKKHNAERSSPRVGLMTWIVSSIVGKRQRTGVDLIGQGLCVLGAGHSGYHGLAVCYGAVYAGSRDAFIVHVNGYVLTLKLGSGGGKLCAPSLVRLKGRHSSPARRHSLPKRFQHRPHPGE